MNNKLKLKEGQEVTINVPFTYTIGEENYLTGEIFETVEDCMNAVRAELENGLIDPMLEVGNISE